MFAFDVTDDEQTRRRKIGDRLGEVTDGERIADFVAEIFRAPSDREGSTHTNVQLRAARQNALLMGDQVTRACAELVASECKRRPVVLVLEDLHWGDAPSIAVVDAAPAICASRITTL